MVLLLLIIPIKMSKQQFYNFSFSYEIYKKERRWFELEYLLWEREKLKIGTKKWAISKRNF